jgi:PEP-CTERM motif
MQVPQWLKLVVILEAAAFANLAHAASVVLNFAGADSWTATWTAPGLALVQGPPTTLSLAFTSLSPVSIVFTENNAAAADNFGFRLTAMSEAVTNNTGATWTGFTETLIDPTVDNSGAFHPQFAHFHQDTGFSGAPFTLTSGGASQRTLQFGNGTVNNGGTWNPAGIGIHDFQLNGQTRTFTLVLAPNVPEPGTFVLALGGVVLALARRMIRRPN